MKIRVFNALKFIIFKILKEYFFNFRMLKEYHRSTR